MGTPAQPANQLIGQRGQNDQTQLDETTPDDGHSAPEMISVLCGQILTLETLALTLESTLADTICECQAVAPETIHTLQRVDFLRQSLKDVAGMLTLLGPNLAWVTGRQVSYDVLRSVVDMHGSVDGMRQDEQSASDEDGDIWF